MMDKLVYLYYPLLLILLFRGAKIYKQGEWNDDVLSLKHTKAFLGFEAVIIVLHHCSQRTCAPWLPPSQIHHGLDVFVFLGYLCVSVFFFCSGYGMYLCLHRKENALDRFFSKRILPLLLAGLVSWLMFFIAEKLMGYTPPKPTLFHVNTYIWYIPVMILLYLLFYVSFKAVKNESVSIGILVICTIAYFIAAMRFSPGTWWYNATHLFVTGVIIAKHSDGFLAGMKKLYLLIFPVCMLIFAVFFMFGNYYYAVCTMLHIKPDETFRVMSEPYFQAVSASAFIFILILIGLKVRIGNRMLYVLGIYTLEIYLIHPLFVRLFGFASFEDNVRPLFYIKNQFLYVLAVAVLSLPPAYLLHAALVRIKGFVDK